MIKTGFNEFDEAIDIQKNDLIVVASRPNMGKSTFAINIMINNNIPILVFALEEYKETIIRRLSDNGLKDVSNIFIDDTPKITICEIIRLSKKLKEQKNIELIIIDYLQLINDDNISKEEIVKELKLLADELNVPIVLVSQLVRIIEKRKPTLEDINNKILIEKADKIILLHRESSEKALQVIIAKNDTRAWGTFELDKIDNMSEKGYVYATKEGKHICEVSHKQLENSNTYMSKNDLIVLATDKAYHLYGRPLPKEIKERLDLELNSIIENEFTIAYMITRKLVEKSNEYGYLVGNRGCIGSSFVAYLLGITECNPLPKKYNGFDIPFETFSRMNDKIYYQSIDLNVAMECKDEMCKYLDEILKENLINISDEDIKESIEKDIFRRNIETNTDNGICGIYILEHELLTKLKKLQDLTNIAPKTIPLNNKETLKVFNYINREESEFYFGNSLDRVKNIISKIKVYKFDDLVKIFNLVHGTGIWENNTEDILSKGIATLDEVISSRDDIMLYLIEKGIDRITAYKIMENIRKGKGLTEEMELSMLEHNIPHWYINSCNKITYLFPKAHAVGYAILLFRLAWYETHYPKEFKTVMEK